METTHLFKAFADGLQMTDPDDGTITLRCHTLGELVLTSGKVVACDPIAYADWAPFVATFPPGRYPVVVSVAEFAKDGDERVAFALLRFSTQAPVRWEMAMLPGQDVSRLREDEIFCYPVDAGVGCFMDAETAATLHKRLKEEDYFEEVLEPEFAQPRACTFPWLTLCLVPETGANLIAFSSGWGDGLYASYLGYDEAGSIVCLVTDFDVLERELLLGS